MQCAYCGDVLSPSSAFCGSCGRPQPASALPERMYYDGPEHSRVERDLASIVASIVAQPQAAHHVWTDGFDDWKSWDDLTQLKQAVEREQAKQAEDPANVARYEQTAEELLGDGNHDAWKLSELAELRSHLGVTEDTHKQIVARLAASMNTDLRVQVDQASMRAFRAEQFCVIQLRLANAGQKGLRSVHVVVATSSTDGLVEQDSPYIPPGSDELITLRLKPETAGQHEFRALLTTRSFTGQESHYRTRPMVFSVARAHESGGAQVYNMDLSAMQVGKIGNMGVQTGGQAGLGAQADWVTVQLTAIGETAAQEWRTKHGGRPKGPPPAHSAPAPPKPPGLPDLFHLGPDGTSEAALPVKTVVEKILAAPDAVHNVWHDGFSGWKLWSDVPELAALVKAARSKAEDRRALLAREKEAARKEAEQESALARLRAERDQEMARIRAELAREREQAEQAAAQARQEAAREIARVREQASASSDKLTLRLLDFGSEKVAVIKLVRSISGLGLRDAKRLVETCPSTIKTWDDPGDRPVAQQAADSLREAGARVELSGGSPASQSAPPAATSSSALTLRMLDYGSRKVAVIKALRAFTGLGLKDAKELVERSPTVVKEWDDPSDRAVAQQAANSLRAVGARVELLSGAPAASKPKPTAPSPASGPLTLRLLSFGSNKIAVIKAVRFITSLGLKDAKQLVERAPTKVTEWDPREERRLVNQGLESLRQAGARAEVIESDTGPVLRLLEYGSNKIAAIKAVRGITGLGLKDAKALVESAPTKVKAWDFSQRRKHFRLWATQLRNAGAQVELDG